MVRVMAAPFILFQGRILNTAHLVSLVPPRIDNGKHVIEARMVGNVTFVEEYEDDEVAAGRYLDLAAALLADPGLSTEVRRPDTIAAPAPEPVVELGDPGLAELTAQLQRDLASGIDVR
jgi:hypothetical protein